MWADLPVLCGCFPLAIYLHLVVYICPWHSLTSSQLTLPTPRVLKSILYVCIFIPVLPLGSSEPFFFFQIPYICVSIRYLFFSFWVTSLCMTDSRSIHLTTNNSISFLFMKAWFFLNLSEHKYFFKINLFIYFFGCVGSSLLLAGSLPLWRAGATPRCSARASHCSVLSRCGAQAPDTWSSAVVAWGPSSCGSRATECRLSSCGSRAQLLHGMWDPPGPGLEPVSPALAGGFLTTVPPGKPRKPDF